ncbi:MAG: hypothetical protein DMF98_00735 [Acidobacteria bacterium]|nr:MAG: hypothetical protein DMF98_00735 [Acidobacteriota bacterium]
MNPLVPLARQLGGRSVRYVLIGVGGANHYAPGGSAVFVTDDHDLFLPLEPDNLVNCWAACEASGLELWSGDEPLDSPRDRWLAEVDLTLVMKAYEFETVWQQRRHFTIEGIEVCVARLLHIVTSKHAAGRDKDKLFLATHREALEQLLKRND